jgi:hypothetical protein
MNWVLTAIHWHLMATSLTVFSGNIAAILIYFMIPGTLAYLIISSPVHTTIHD